MDTRQYDRAMWGETPDGFEPEEGTDVLHEGMAFLSENPEAFGHVTDAYPIAVGDWMVAANGHGYAAGGLLPTYPVAEGGVDALFDTLYGTLLRRNAANTAVLSRTFGDSTARQEHPIPRYCAALAEAVALQVLAGPARGASFEQTALLLGDEIPRALDGLRTAICRDGLTAPIPELFSVSMGICRILEHGEGAFTLDLYCVGDYRVYLLDSAGMRPLYLSAAPSVSPDAPTAPPVGRRIHLHHPEPFAILLLSGSVCVVNPAEERNLRERPGFAWRYRMRLEEYILRIITACVREEEFGERAARFFTGRARGRDSASGAMAILRGENTYEAFRTLCHTRLARLEDIISLLPEGYDPADVEKQPSRTEVEHTYIRRLFVENRSLATAAAEALRCAALEHLRNPDRQSTPPPPDVPDYRRLNPEELIRVYQGYDAENNDDRAGIDVNCAVLREQLADHWMTLRPILLGVVGNEIAADPAVEHHRAVCNRDFDTILLLNERLGSCLSARRAHLEQMESILSDCLGVLRAMGDDWLHGRAGEGQPTAWAYRLVDDLPPALLDILNDRAPAEDAYNALHTAYAAERDGLFARDIASGKGAFAAEWEAIRDGALPEDRWAAYRAAIVTGTEDEDYAELWDMLHRISRGTGVRLTRIRDRVADLRMARDMANQPELQVAAVRASAYEDPDWGNAVHDILSDVARNNYLTVVRRWKETQELLQRRAEAYETYRAMYEGDLGD